jgi:glucose/arabinose dehydrogenase
MKHRTILALLGLAAGAIAACSGSEDSRSIASAHTGDNDNEDCNASGSNGYGDGDASECDDEESRELFVASGYTLETLATGLDFPTAIASDGAGRLWVTEGAPTPDLVPRVRAVDETGDVTTVLAATDLADGVLAGPLTDVTWRDGWLWITHRQTGANGWLVGAISRFQPADPRGTFTTVITNLPSAGDHYAEEIVFDATGRAYFSQGSATNSGVVGPDNELITGWLAMFPDFHDFAPVDLVLAASSYRTLNPLTEDPNDRVVTAPFQAFGSGPVSAGTRVLAATPAQPREGMIAGNGAVYSFDADAAGSDCPPGQPSSSTPDLRLEAWGLRNPYGIGLDPADPSRLYVTNNGADIRSIAQPSEQASGVSSYGGYDEGDNDDEDEDDEDALSSLLPVGSRPIANDWDDLYVLDVGGDQEFYGWPDYYHLPSGDVAPVTDPFFCRPEYEDQPQIECPTFVLESSFRAELQTERAVAEFETHVSANKFDVASGCFAGEGDIFVAETGSFVPITGATEFVGYKVVRVNRETGEVRDFIGQGEREREDIFQPEAFSKPIDVKFDGDRMLIVDFGMFEPGLGIQVPGTGKIWVVRRSDGGLAQGD